MSSACVSFQHGHSETRTTGREDERISAGVERRRRWRAFSSSLAEKSPPASRADRIAHRTFESHDRPAGRSNGPRTAFCIRSFWAQDRRSRLAIAQKIKVQTAALVNRSAAVSRFMPGRTNTPTCNSRRCYTNVDRRSA
jgi:hypothetical protein